MTKEEVIHLAKLARIELSDTELENFTKEMSAILSYVSSIKEMVGDEVIEGPTVGDRFNVFRPDVVSNEPNSTTKEILAEMPETEGRFLVVKKILQSE
jgi:aspartyl-tRNA(Asn)/glutamyl-tRNA(Gln) amidotransferase subunit C